MNQIEKLKKEIERLKNEERSNLDEAPKRKFRRVSNWMKEAKYEAEHENMISVCKDGTYLGTYGHSYDLFFADEEKLTEFEEAIGLKIFDAPFDNECIRVIKEESTKLRELARKELEPEILERLETTYENGKRAGKAEALKDLPRWKKCTKDTLRSFGDEHFEYRRDGCYVVMRGREILLSDLEKLPKERRNRL